MKIINSIIQNTEFLGSGQNISIHMLFWMLILRLFKKIFYSVIVSHTRFGFVFKFIFSTLFIVYGMSHSVLGFFA